MRQLDQPSTIEQPALPSLSEVSLSPQSPRNSSERVQITKGFTKCAPYQLPRGKESLRWNNLTLNEQVLLNALESSYSRRVSDEFSSRHLVDRTRYRGKVCALDVEDLNDVRIRNVVDAFRHDPKAGHAIIRANIINLGRSMPQIQFDTLKDLHSFLQERIMRYYDASVSLIMRLDAAAFPPTHNKNAPAQPGVLPYLPDGYSDMGKEQQIDEAYRGREKIRVDKGTDLAMIRDIMCTLFWQAGHMIDPSGTYYPTNSDDVKQHLIQSIATWVHGNMRYDLQPKPINQYRHRSIKIADFVEAGEGVCRHFSLFGQIMLQHCGITSRLFKCSVNGVPHATNHVRINRQWHLLDITSPNQDGSPFLEKLPLSPHEKPDAKSYRLQDRSYTPNHLAYHRILPRKPL